MTGKMFVFPPDPSRVGNDNVREGDTFTNAEGEKFRVQQVQKTAQKEIGKGRVVEFDKLDLPLPACRGLMEGSTVVKIVKIISKAYGNSDLRKDAWEEVKRAAKRNIGKSDKGQGVGWEDVDPLVVPSIVYDFWFVENHPDNECFQDNKIFEEAVKIFDGRSDNEDLEQKKKGEKTILPDDPNSWHAGSKELRNGNELADLTPRGETMDVMDYMNCSDGKISTFVASLFLGMGVERKSKNKYRAILQASPRVNRELDIEERFYSSQDDAKLCNGFFLSRNEATDFKFKIKHEQATMTLYQLDKEADDDDLDTSSESHLCSLLRHTAEDGRDNKVDTDCIPSQLDADNLKDIYKIITVRILVPAVVLLSPIYHLTPPNHNHNRLQ